MQHFRSASIQLSKDGIVVFQPQEDDVYTEQDLIAILDLMEMEAGGQPFKIMMLLNEFEFLMTKEARNLFNEYEKAILLIRAEAVVTNSTSTKILYNLLTLVHAPKFPLKAFTDETKAIEWLMTECP